MDLTEGAPLSTYILLFLICLGQENKESEKMLPKIYLIGDTEPEMESNGAQSSDYDFKIIYQNPHTM